MKVTITAAGGSVFTLADDSVAVVVGSTFAAGAGGQIKEGFVNKQQRQAQVSPLFRAAYALLIPRFNLKNRFSFTAQRSFQTVESCIAFIAFHPDSVPTSGEVALDNQSATGRIFRYLPNAVVETVECAKHVGLSCNFTYTISGNGPWQMEP
ncbi:MAG TPA: hypothetical protein VGO67_25270 [Verrucomicrobiae bacterium]|jgi:hypothetical protein